MDHFAVVCDSKKRFNTILEAYASKRAMMKRPNRRRKLKLFVYRCPECRGFHITHCRDIRPKWRRELDWKLRRESYREEPVYPQGG